MIADRLKRVSVSLTAGEKEDLRAHCLRSNQAYEAAYRHRLEGMALAQLGQPKRYAAELTDAGMTIAVLPTSAGPVGTLGPFRDRCRPFADDTSISVIVNGQALSNLRFLYDAGELEIHGETESTARPRGEDQPEGDRSDHAGLEGGQPADLDGAEGEKPKGRRRPRAG